VLRYLLFIQNFIGIDPQRTSSLKRKFLGQLRFNDPEHRVVLNVFNLQIQITTIGTNVFPGTDSKKNPDGEHLADAQVLEINARVIGKLVRVIIRQFCILHTENMVALFQDFFEKRKAVEF